MSTVPSASRRSWAAWTVVVPTVIGGLLAALFGSFGWFINSFGIGTNCTNKFDCGGNGCAPCTSMIRWVVAGGIGQWVLVVAAGILLTLGMKRPDSRRVAAIASLVIVPLPIAWWIISTIVAEHSF